MSALTGGLGLLERATGYTLGALTLVTPEALTRPTPCAGWDVHTLLVHLDDALRALDEAVAAGRVALDAPSPARPPGASPAADLSGTAADRTVVVAVDGETRAAGRLPGAGGTGGNGGAGVELEEVADGLVRGLRDRACRMLGEWVNARSPGVVRIADRQIGAPVVAAAGALEIAVHGWDLSRGCGVDRPLPEPLARDLTVIAQLLVRDADRPVRFAAPVPVPPSAGHPDRLLAFLGRHP